MTEAKPPEFYFDGIEFNSQYFKDESDIIGFTQDESDARYLRKTEQDTATAIETFTGGIKTNSIESVLTTDTLNIQTISDTASNIVNVGNATTNNQTLNLNSKIINVGDTTVPSAINIISPATFTPSATFTNGISSLNVDTISGQNFSIATNQVGGTLSIGTGGTRTGSISIGTGMLNSAIIAIGSNTGSFIKFGSTTSTTQIQPNTSTLNITNVTSTANSTDFRLCEVQTIGALDIGNNALRTGAINIATTKNTSSAQSINIGSTNTSATGQIISINRPLTIGYSVNPTTINQIGGTAFINGTEQSYATISTTGGSLNLAVLNSIPIGIYQVFYNISTTITVATAIITERSITVSSATGDTTLANTLNFMRDSDLIHQTRVVGHDITVSGGGILVNTTSSIAIYLNQRYIYSAGPTVKATGHLRIVRIG